MRVCLIDYPGLYGLEAAFNALVNRCRYDCVITKDSEEALRDADVVVIPSGAAYGDALRPGALAKVSRISGALRRFGEAGGRILGIGNGFQILCELGLLPGAFLANRAMRYLTGRVYVRVETKNSFITKNAGKPVLHLPIGTSHGCYVADYRSLLDLEESHSVLLRYCDKEGELDPDLEPTGSANQIAGIMNRGGNVIGIMVTPELAVDALTGGFDGLELLRW